MRNAPTFASRFVGRARERARLVRLIASHRLVTVTGLAGVGKTRLVAEAVLAWDRRFPGGRWWFDLTSIREPDLIEEFVADQLGVRARRHRDLPTAVATRLAGEPALLVFDNCEHLLAGAAKTTSRLLASCASLRVLTTSRQLLGIAGEALLPLDPLANEDAVRLFIDRARLRRPDLQSVGQTRVELARLCERIDNLPLAVELAAARAAHLSPQDMLDRLDRRFDLLTTPAGDVVDRHRTLLAALDWSYRLLDPPEQQLLNRLAVLAGPFDLAVAEALGDPKALDGLVLLIDKSLVTAAPSPRGMRYRLLEAVRDFGLDRLSEAGGAEAVRDQLLDHFLVEVEAAYEERMRSGSDRLLLLLADSADNLRVALDHAQATRQEDGLRLAGAMREEWVRRNPREGRLWLRRFVATHPDRDRYLARALLAMGHITAIAEQEYPEGRRALEQSREVCREAGDSDGEAWATFFLGAAATLADDFDAAQQHLERALAMQQENGSAYGVLQARASLGQLLAISGRRLVEGRTLLEGALAASRQLGNRWSSGHAHTFLGVLELREHHLGAAIRNFRQAVAEFEAVNDQVMLAAALCGLARSIVSSHPQQGLRVAAAAAAIHARLGSRFAAVWISLLEETRTQAAAKLSPSAAQQEWESGSRLGAAEVVELQSAKPSGRPDGLTRREFQVARLVADGLSNRAVAEQLHISERTAEAHVLHILNKLGLASRGQIARWLHESSTA